MKLVDVLVFIIALIIGWLSTSGVKTQFVRLVDVFLYGPILIYVGLQFDNIILRYLMIFIGATTMSYNLKNYIYENKKLI